MANHPPAAPFDLAQLIDNNSDLLRPSLTADQNSSIALYSLRTEFLTAFFGGPVGGATVALINSFRLKRLAVDWPLGLLAIAFCAGMGWLSTHGGWGWLDVSLGRGSGVYGTRVINLVFFGVVYAFHRTYYKSMSVLGTAAPNGLPVGIGATILGLFANAAMIKVWTP